LGTVTDANPVTDPSHLSGIMEDTFGTVGAILQTLNQLLDATTVDELPPSDVENALNIEYDSNIDGDIANSPEEAYTRNILKVNLITH